MYDELSALKVHHRHGHLGELDFILNRDYFVGSVYSFLWKKITCGEMILDWKTSIEKDFKLIIEQQSFGIV